MNTTIPKEPNKENHTDGKENRGQSKRQIANDALEEVKVKNAISSSNNPVGHTKESNKTFTPSKNTLAPEMNVETALNEEKSETIASNRNVEISEQEKALIEKNNRAAEQLQKYLQSTGISLAFQLIFSEVVQKKIPQEKVFSYASQRLKQIGADIQELKAQKI